MDGDPLASAARASGPWAELSLPAAVRLSFRDGVMTLTGTVHSRLDADRAEAALAGFYGVESVVNELEVGLPRPASLPEPEAPRPRLRLLREPWKRRATARA